MSHTTGQQRIVKRELDFWWCSLGMLAGSLSLISLIQNVLKIGLAPLPRMVIDYYRAVLRPLHELLVYIIPFELPAWYVDCYILSVIAISAYYRSALKGDYDAVCENDRKWGRTIPRQEGALALIDSGRQLLASLIVAAISSVFLAGLALVAVAPLRFAVSFHRRDRHGGWVEGSVFPNRLVLSYNRFDRNRYAYFVQRNYLVSLLMLAIAASAFFAWNFQAQ
jgi:hypothetical protein